jgi:hypothetical protein
MHVVALCELTAPVEQEEGPIAELLGLSAYDVRLRLAGTLPRVVLRTDDGAAAQDLLALLVRRGHGALSFAADDAPAVDRLPLVRHFRAEGESVFADGAGPSRPATDLVAIVRFALHGVVDRTFKEQRLVYSGRSLAPAVQQFDRTVTEQAKAQRALLVFRDGLPWLLDPAQARYQGLGALRPTQVENFLATLEWFARRSPGTVEDHRFLEHPLAVQKRAAVRSAATATHDPVRADRPVDWTLHALAGWLAAPRGGPYRGNVRIG